MPLPQEGGWDTLNKVFARLNLLLVGGHWLYFSFRLGREAHPPTHIPEPP